MQERQEERTIESLKEMLATAIALGMACSPDLISGSVLDEERSSIVGQMKALHRAVGVFLESAGIEKSADDALPVFQELVSQLPTGVS